MENRRQDFRYTFTPKPYWKATFHAVESANSFSAEIVNLSIGGICVKLAPDHLAKGERWTMTVELSAHGEPLRIPVERVHPDNGVPGTWGFRFLPLPNGMEQAEQDRRIWKFILEEQRRDRRKTSREE